MAEPDHQPSSSDAVPAPILRNPAWASLPWLQHGFSTRSGGVSTIYGHPDDLNLGWTKEDSPLNVEENRRRLIDAVSFNNPFASRLVTLRQIHSNLSLVLPDLTLPAPSSPGQPLCEGDGLLTDTPGLLLGIQTADCVPVLVVDLRRRAVAAFHAGWRGTVTAILERGLASLHERFGSNPEDLSATIGPAIGPCCYTVGEEVHSRFHAAFPYASELFQAEADKPTWRLNLWEANRRQLLGAGLRAEDITVLAHCTACSAATKPIQQSDSRPPSFFSYRAEGGFTGRMMSVVGVTTSSDPRSDSRPEAR